MQLGHRGPAAWVTLAAVAQMGRAPDVAVVTVRAPDGGLQRGLGFDRWDLGGACCGGRRQRRRADV